MELSYEIVEGLQMDKGYVSAYMVTNPERMEAEMKDALILITDKKIGNVQEILPLLEKVAQSGKKELVIIADDVEGDALSTFIVNKLRGAFSRARGKSAGLWRPKEGDARRHRDGGRRPSYFGAKSALSLRTRPSRCSARRRA